MKAYEGPELPRSEIAVLDGMHKHGGVLALVAIVPIPKYKHEAFILEIDGKRRRSGRYIHILPGQHTARVYYYRYPDVTLCSIGCLRNYFTRLRTLKSVADGCDETDGGEEVSAELVVAGCPKRPDRRFGSVLI